MCTLSLVQSCDGSALRLLMNRDERRLRPVAWPPVAAQVDGVRVLRPLDPPSGGTWIAVSDAGLALALLNAGCRRDRADGPSRGTIIPALISAESLDELVERWARLDLAPVAPFTLVAATLTQVAMFSHPAAGHSVGACSSTHPAVYRRPGHFAPLVVTSSSLGDDLVRGPRLELFDRLMAGEVDRWKAQDRFHQHAWPDRRHLSVLMSRPDACTVSRTEVLLTPERIEMRYATVIDGWPAAVSAMDLGFTRARAVMVA